MEHYSTWRTCMSCSVFSCPGNGQRERACTQYVEALADDDFDDDDFDDGEYERKQVERERRYLESL